MYSKSHSSNRVTLRVWEQSSTSDLSRKHNKISLNVVAYEYISTLRRVLHSKCGGGYGGDLCIQSHTQVIGLHFECGSSHLQVI